MLFLSRVQVPSHSTWLFSGEKPLAFRTWRPHVGSTMSLYYSAHLLSWFSDLVLSTDFGWVFDFLFGETEEMSKYVKTFEWPLPKSIKKLQKAPQTLTKYSPELRECLDFLPRETVLTLEHPWRKPQESGKPFCNRRHREKPLLTYLNVGGVCFVGASPFPAPFGVAVDLTLIASLWGQRIVIHFTAGRWLWASSAHAHSRNTVPVVGGEHRHFS